MKIAVPEWQGRISPVFDVAEDILLIDMEKNREKDRQTIVLAKNTPWERAGLLRRMRVNVLICGAVSWPLEMALKAKGIQVISNICGQIEAVLAAFRNQRLIDNAYLMPGCCGRGLQRRHRRQPTGIQPKVLVKGVNFMPRGNGMGPPQGGGGRGRGGGPFAAGPGGACVCPTCGYKEPHSPGDPCNQKGCPKCGTRMVRGS